MGIALLSVFGGMLGCSSPQPFARQESWLVCENARPHYFALYDIFYLGPQRYSGTGEYPYAACERARRETVEPFGVHTRVFAPIYRDAQDAEAALEHYLDLYHGNGLPWPVNEEGRPFVFIGEGEGAKILEELSRRDARRLRRKGFLGGWYSPDTTNGFVTAAVVTNVREAVRSEIHRRTWGHEDE